MTIFLIIIGLIIAIMFILSIKRKRDLKKMENLISIINGENHIEIQNPYGEFGYTITNPIPVKSIIDSVIYLDRLRTLEGEKIKYARIGADTASNIEMPVDIYEIYVNEKVITTLYISAYNHKNSKQVPKNFKLTEI